MNKFKFIAVALSVACTACVKDIDAPQDEILAPHVYVVSLDSSTKTSADAAGKLNWNTGDVVRYYSSANGTVGSATVPKAGASASLIMDVATGAKFLVAVYGGTGVSQNTSGNAFVLNDAVTAEQSGKFEDAHVAVAKTYDVNTESFKFANVTSLIRFTLERTDVAYAVFESNDDTALHGNGTLKFSFSDENHTASFGENTGNSIKVTVGNSGDFYISTLACTLAQGFNMTFFKANGAYVGKVATDSHVTLAKNKILNLGTLDSRIDATYEANLSLYDTANCYIVSMAGEYYFDATVRGCSTEQIGGNGAYADVLWESFGNDVQPQVGDIITDCRYENGKIYFKATGSDGNAVIALTNRDDEILWSWHIWVCNGFDPAATAQEYYNDAGTVMDRNLGATSVTKGDVKALGLLYQWGRKDPFPGSSLINKSVKAKSTVTWPAAVESDAGTGTIDYVVKHPSTFVARNIDSNDWYYSNDGSADNTRWNSVKGMFDPCPHGWKVPDGGSEGLWSKALGSSSSFSGCPWDSASKSISFAGKFSSAPVWYSAPGCLNDLDGTLYNVGYTGNYWSSTPNDGNAYFLGFYSSGNVNPSYYGTRASGYSVRCVKESAPEPEPEAKDLSADGTANCYIVSEYGTCKFDATKKGHTSESVGTIASAGVLWESFGDSVQPAVGDIVKDVTVQNGIVSFTASGKDGNAVIAVKDAAGDILWSWHIWVSEGFDPEATAQVYYNNAGTFMDRNLGATSSMAGDVKATGLMYQWGRKDPFLGGDTINKGSDRAKSTIVWPSSIKSNASTGTFDFVVKNPTTFVTSTSDWYYTESSKADDTRWNSDKGMYDPCPQGWHVPNRDYWAKASGVSGDSRNVSFDVKNNGMNFGASNTTISFSKDPFVWYPAAGGYSNSGSGNFNESGAYWTNAMDYEYYYSRYRPRSMTFYYVDGSNFSYYTVGGANSVGASGKNVRCQKE